MLDEKFIFALLSILISIKGALLTEDGFTVGCVKCHPLDTDKINVHLVPHSHDDVGWLKTFDEYYFGLNTKAVGQPVAVKNIISTVVEELLKNPERRFIQVETSFFYKWWQHQNPDMQNNFKKLVDNGQIEIVSGGWSMNDEASTNYQSTIDQFTLGLRKIEETIGKCGRSRIGWQIDTFGHSRQQASISAQLGFDGLFFARLDHDDLAKRQKEHKMDFIWKGSANLDDTIFSSIFPENGYGSPNGFCWDINCGDDQIVDDLDSVLYNVPEKVKDFTNVLDRYSKFYSNDNKNIFITMGGDFQYQAADFQFENIDKLIKGFHNHTKYNVFYSTPSCYVKAVHDANATLSLKQDDFFPYSDHNHTFWAGYFTSRPNLKRFERVGHQILQATKQIYALGSDKNNDHFLNDLNEAMGIVQHHDAITGTEKQAVSDDYIRMLTAAIKKAEEPTGRIINELLQGHPDIKLNLSSCLLSNVSICSISQNSDKFVVVVYNPLAWKTKYYVRLPVENNKYAVDGPDGQQVFDLLPSLSKFKFVEIKNETPSTYELVFQALDIPPMGFKVYHIQKLQYLQSEEKEIHSQPEINFVQVNNGNLQLNLGLNNVTLNMSEGLYYYNSSDGSDNSDYASSGAYIFTPKQGPATPILNPRIIGNYNGSLLREVHINWTDENVEAYQSIRWYKNEDYIEFNWLVGNINVKLNQGKEVITRFKFGNVDNKNIFYTDSNGRETIQRIRNTRSDYDYDPSLEPVASNYYPVTSKIVIKDVQRNIQVAILNDRAQGGSSLDNNQVELMLHRRLVYDDKRGVGEPLNEKEFSKQLGMYTRGSFYLMYGKINDTSNVKSTTAQERIFAHKKLLEPWVGLSPTQMSFLDLKSAINLTYSALNKELPENVNILSFERWTNESFLLRLEHIMEKNDDFNLSQPATVDLRYLFKNIDLGNIVETTLGANIPLSELSPRYKWKTEHYMDVSSHSKSYQSNNNNDGSITLNPMEIRTFIVTPSHQISAGTIVPTNIFLSIFILILIYFRHLM